MPSKKKGGGRKSNKKKGNRSKSSSSPGGSASTASIPLPRLPPINSANNNIRNHLYRDFEGILPDLRGFERRNPIHPDDYPTVYQRYKNATKRFLAYMEKQARAFGACMLPDKTKMSVNTLLTVADRMNCEGRATDPLALRDLKLTIRIRSRVAKSVFGGGDSGHKYFLKALIYCWTILVKLPREATHDYAAQPSSSGSQANRFGVFHEHIDDEELDDMDMDAEFFPSFVPHPEPEPETMMNLEDLMNSDERHDAVLFLLSLDEIMDSIVQQYQAVYKNHLDNVAQGIPQSNIIEMLIEASVATNMGIQQVQRLEVELGLQYPHLTTPYRLLSTIVLPDITMEVTSILRRHASRKVTEKDVIIFLGDCLECTFRNVSDPSNRSEFVVPEFCEEYRVDSHGSEKLSKIVEGLRKVTIFEVPMAVEKNQNHDMFASFMRMNSSIKSHSWLPNMPQIGGGRAIHHTIRLLQSFGQIIKETSEKSQAIARRGFFGPSPWVQGKSSKIAGDMDELLMAEILPKFITIFRIGILGTVELPMVGEIAPLWSILRDYVRHPEKAVSWSLAFSVHAMLSAILETDQITDTLMKLSENAFQTFFTQVKWASNLLQNEPDSLIEDPTFLHNVVTVLFLENLSLPVSGKRAIWNPLYAGTILSYLTFFGNMEAGCSLVDNHAQLRIVMFLYHGLMLNGIIEIGQIPFLDIMFASFKNSRAVWEGELPRRGELVKRFWMCFGLNLVDSRTMAEEAREKYDSSFLSSRGADAARASFSGRPRKMNPIRPEEISKSYRRVCNHDFHDVEDKYHTTEQRERAKNTDYYMLAVRVNDTLDAIDEEQALFSFNLMSCGVILEQFVCSLTRIMQWDYLIKSFMADTPDFQPDLRQGTVHMFAQHLLAALDFSSDPMDHEFLNVPVGRASSAMLAAFFTRLSPEHVTWFNAVGCPPSV